jgi:hypothetical protein
MAVAEPNGRASAADARDGGGVRLDAEVVFCHHERCTTREGHAEGLAGAVPFHMQPQARPALRKRLL